MWPAQTATEKKKKKKNLFLLLIWLFRFFFYTGHQRLIFKSTSEGVFVKIKLNKPKSMIQQKM